VSRPLLALETSGKSGGAAILYPDGRLVEGNTPPESSSATGLAPLIEGLLNAEGLAAKDLVAVAVTVGPGSFTGLRVGVAMAKALAYGLAIPVVAVDSLETLARSVRAEPGQRLWTVSDAYRGELFTAAWEVEEDADSAAKGMLRSLIGTAILSREDWIATVDQHLTRTEQRAAMPSDLFLGSGLLRVAGQEEVWRRQSVIDWLPQARPTAAQVAHIGWERLEHGLAIDPFQLMPVYLRGSAAEEKLRTKPSR
jgi:tRNA threonylcarbamoyladenosine biosynthesis protein TsaB